MLLLEGEAMIRTWERRKSNHWIIHDKNNVTFVMELLVKDE